MSRTESPEMIARMRTVSAEALLGNRVNLREYPFRHLAVSCQTGIGPDRMAHAMAAVELLDRYGWELVNLSEFGTSRVLYAIMRRREPPGP